MLTFEFFVLKKNFFRAFDDSKKFVYYNEELEHKFESSNAIISKTTTIQKMP